MTQSTISSPCDFRVVPWRNGQGSTVELRVGYLAARRDEFAWRLSMARVIADGDFSDFSGYDRTLILLGGQGIILNHASGQRDELRQRFDMARFSGNWKTSATLIDGAIQDFNVMTRRGDCSAQVDVLTIAGIHELTLDADILLLYPVDEDIRLLTDTRREISVPAGHLFEMTGRQHDLWSLEGRSVIRIRMYHRP